MRPAEDPPDRVVALLKSAPLCEGLAEDAVSALAGRLRPRPFHAGETLALPGESAAELWVVADGEIDAFVTDPRGRERPLGAARRGEAIGDISILEGTPRPVRFTARTAGELLAAPAADFRAWVEAHPAVLRNLLHILTQRFRQAIGVAERAIPCPRLGVVAPSPRGRLLAARLVARLAGAGERLRVWADAPDALRASGAWPGGIPIHPAAGPASPVPEPTCPAADRRVVVRTLAGSGGDDPLFLDCDEVLWLMEPGGAPPAGTAGKVRVVWVLGGQSPVSPPAPGWQGAKRPIKVPVETEGTGLNRLERQGVDHLVRALRGYSLGIALAGGGAKGMAHLGVLRVLDEAGVSFDAMSGTSAGAMAGILYASGLPPLDAVEHFQRDLTASRLMRSLPKWPNWYLVAQFRRRTWDAMLRRYLHDWRLEQLLVPFHAVTVDLVRVQPVVRSEGDAVHAILESINLPVVSRPILRDGMALVDGGVLNNLPADVLAERAVDFVVGVDVSRRVRHEFADNRPETPTARMKPAGAVETLLRVFEAQAHGIGGFRNRAVDFWITPDTSPFGLADFHKTRDIAAAGEAAARQCLAQLEHRIAELERGLLGPARGGATVR